MSQTVSRIEDVVRGTFSQLQLFDDSIIVKEPDASSDTSSDSGLTYGDYNFGDQVEEGVKEGVSSWGWRWNTRRARRRENSFDRRERRKASRRDDHSPQREYSRRRTESKIGAAIGATGAAVVETNDASAQLLDGVPPIVGPGPSGHHAEGELSEGNQQEENKYEKDNPKLDRRKMVTLRRASVWSDPGNALMTSGTDRDAFSEPVLYSKKLMKIIPDSFAQLDHEDRGFLLPSPRKAWHPYTSTREAVISGKFRILELHKGGPKDSLSASLILERATVNLEEATIYEALSYAWGSAKKSVPILLYEERNPREESVSIPVLITPSLESALRHLRFKTRPRYLWVDALCINQDDDVEKSYQIPMMPDIYYRAKNVCVWLGEAAENSNLAFDLIYKLLHVDAFDQLSRDHRLAEEWKALSALMRRPWFTRRWVIQEISRSRAATIHCGSDQARWQDFADVITLIEGGPRDIAQILYEAQDSISHSETLGAFKFLGASRLVEAAQRAYLHVDDGPAPYPVLTLETLMSLLVPFKASDPRDVVYSILSLAKDTKAVQPVIREPIYTRVAKLFRSKTRSRVHEPIVDTEEVLLEPLSHQKGSESDVEMMGGRFLSASEKPRLRNSDEPAITDLIEGKIQVDYRKDVLAVFKDFVGFVIRQSNSLDVICRPWAPDDVLNLPSWIPNLSRATYSMDPNGIGHRKNADSLAEDPGQGIRTYHASGSKSPQIRLTEDPLGLEVVGFVVDRIDELATPALNGVIPPDWVSMGSWDVGAHSPPPSLWRTLVANRGLNGRFPPYYYEKACSYAFGLRDHLGKLDTSQTLERPLGSMAKNFLRRMQMVVWNRRLIRTKKYHLFGLCPNTAQKGDVICILYGCSVPVILRKVSEGDEFALTHAQYGLIGECYIHKLMEGEAMLMMKERMVREEKFLIV